MATMRFQINEREYNAEVYPSEAVEGGRIWNIDLDDETVGQLLQDATTGLYTNAEGGEVEYRDLREAVQDLLVDYDRWQ